MTRLFFILYFIRITFCLVKYDSSFSLLQKILSESSFTNNQNDNFNKEIFIFIDKLAHTGIKNTCDTKLIQSDVQLKMRLLKSIVSTCSGYCRLAMSQDGDIYGDREFSLESNLIFDIIYNYNFF